MYNVSSKLKEHQPASLPFVILLNVIILSRQALGNNRMLFLLSFLSWSLLQFSLYKFRHILFKSKQTDLNVVIPITML